MIPVMGEFWKKHSVYSSDSDSGYIIHPEPYSANKQHGGFYVGELQAEKGTVGRATGDPVRPGDHREWA